MRVTKVHSLPKKIMNGEVKLFRYAQSPHIFCRFKSPANGQWVSISTKQTDLAAAENAARNIFIEYKFRHEHKLGISKVKVVAVADLYADELDELVKSGRKKDRYAKDKKKIIDQYIKPYFKDTRLDAVTDDTLINYREWVVNYYKSGPGKDNILIFKREGRKVEYRKTRVRQHDNRVLAGHQSILREMFRIAVNRNYLASNVIPDIKLVDSTKIIPAKGVRPYFTDKEIKDIRKKLLAWIDVEEISNRGSRPIPKIRKQILREYVEFLLASGLRPGTETEHLTWRDMKVIAAPKNTSAADTGYYYLSLRKGKQGSRTAVVTVDGILAVGRIQQLYQDENDHIPDFDKPVFALPDDTPISTVYFSRLFDKFLARHELTCDEQGRKRTLYSLRHTYATMALMGNINTHKLARQMGTSEQMINQHYSHITALHDADIFSQDFFKN